MVPARHRHVDRLHGTAAAGIAHLSPHEEAQPGRIGLLGCQGHASKKESAKDEDITESPQHGNLLLDELHAAVLCAAFVGTVVRDGLMRSLAHGGESALVNAVGHQGVHNGFGTFLA